MPIESAPTNDSLFRVAFAHPEIARQFFSRWIPTEVVSLFDWKSLQLQKISGFTRELVERREDVVYRIEASQDRTDFYILLEHQSKEDRSMPLRMREYVLLIWRSQRKKHQPRRTLPYVLPMVLYLGPTHWKSSTRLCDLIRIPKVKETPWLKQRFSDPQFLLVDLTGVPFEELADGACARAILAALQAERTKSLDQAIITRILKELFSEKEESLVKEIAPYLWTYLIHRSNLQFKAIEDIISEVITPTERPNYMTTAERLINMGKQQGMVRGMKQGLRQGQIRATQMAIIEILRVRFHHVPEGLVDVIKNLNHQKTLKELLRVAGGCLDLEAFAVHL